MENAHYAQMLLVQQNLFEAEEKLRQARADMTRMMENHIDEQTKFVWKTDAEMVKLLGSWWNTVSFIDAAGYKLSDHVMCAKMNQHLEAKYCTLQVIDVKWTDQDTWTWKVVGLHMNGV